MENELPMCAQKRLAQLRAMVDDAEAARSNLQKRLNTLGPSDSLDHAELDKRMRANHLSLTYSRSLLGMLDDFLKKSGALAHFAPTVLKEAPVVNVGTPQWGRIENIRKEVVRIKTEIANIKRAPLPFATIEAQLRTLVNKWASQGEPNVAVDPVKGDVTVTWGFNAPKSNKVLAWINPEAMLARLVEKAKRQSVNKGTPMSADQKEDALKALRDHLQEIELEEVALIDALQLDGVPEAQHRLDISPWALLGVREPRGLMKTALVA